MTSSSSANSRRTSRPHKTCFHKTQKCTPVNETQQMSLFHKGNLVFRSHTKHKGDKATTNKKTQAIQNMLPPKMSKQVHGFLGLVGYYRKLIKNFCKNSKTSDIINTSTSQV